MAKTVRGAGFGMQTIDFVTIFAKQSSCGNVSLVNYAELARGEKRNEKGKLDTN